MAHYHLRFCYCLIIFYFPHLSLLLQKYLCNPYISNHILRLLPLARGKYQMQYQGLSEMLTFFSPFLSNDLSSFPLFFTLLFFRLSFFRTPNYYLIFCLLVWLCIHFILKLPFIFDVSCFESITIIFS